MKKLKLIVSYFNIRKILLILLYEFEYICSSQPSTGSKISGQIASGLILLSSMHISSFASSHDKIKLSEKKIKN